MVSFALLAGQFRDNNNFGEFERMRIEESSLRFLLYTCNV